MRFYTQEEAAVFLGCSEQRLKRLRQAGRLPYIPGRPVIIDETDLVAFVEAEKQRLAKREERNAFAKRSRKMTTEEWIINERWKLMGPRRRRAVKGRDGAT